MLSALAHRSAATTPYPMPMNCRRLDLDPHTASPARPEEASTSGWNPEWKIKYMVVRPDAPRHALPDGCAVQEQDDDAIHVMCGGAAFRVSGAADFHRLGLSEPGVVRQLPSGRLQAMPQRPADGSVFKVLGSEQVNIMVGGAPLPVATRSELSLVNIESRRLVVLPAHAADTMPAVPSDGTTVRVPDTSGAWRLFRVRAGELHPIEPADDPSLREAQPAPHSIFRVLAICGQQAPA